MCPAYYTRISWNSVITVTLLSVLLETLGSTADAACTKYCDAGDTLSGSTCTSTVTASNSCPSGFSPSGGQCVDAGARCSGIISTMYQNIGYCCYGTKMTPLEISPGVYTCFPNPGGWYCEMPSTRGCYTSRGSPSSCPSGSTADGNDCVSSVTYTCPSGYIRSGTTCTDTYAASTITASTQCNRASPATDGCKWCSGVSACLPDAASCPASCLVMPQTTCMSIPSTCQWCSAIGVCQKDSIGCFTSCLIATADSSICDASTSCKYCTGIGVCQPNAGICYATCLAATSESNVCDGSTACKYCSTPGSIGVCQPNGGVCYTSCLAATVEANVCEGSTSCKYCSTSESIGVCQPTGGICYTSCLAASAELAVCGGSDSCQWCATPTSIGVCQPKTGTCWATCPPATEDPLGSAVCSTSQSCKWCPGAAGGVGGIGVCQVNTGTCWASCLSATTDSSNADVCGYSTECKWCPSTTSIGVCQPNSGMCWPMCTPASDDPLGSGVCTTSADCKWCPTLGYCTEQTRNCHILCPTVAPDEPAICQVQSIQAQCQWCGAPGSVEYCVARTDEARLRCASSCGGLIWRQDVCNGALECHWCGVHNAAQGGRCKPLPGKSRGYVAWRREVECYTESETSSATVVMTQSVSASSTTTLTLTMSSTERSETNEDTVTTSSTLSSTVPHFTPSQMISPHSLSYSESATKSNTPTASISHKSESDNTSRTTTYFSKSTVTPSDSRQLSVTVKTPTPTYMHTSSQSQTLDATATNYYYRQWTALDKVVAPLASGLQFLGIGGATTSVSALSRVVASRSVGQCWGQAGSSMLNAAVALCGDLEVGDVDQQEFQGDAIGSLGLTIGVVGVVVLGWVAYGRVHSVSIMTAAEDLSLVTLLSPLWMVIIPVGLGGAAVTVVAPVSTQHPLATTCDGTIGLVVAVALVTIVQLVGLVVVPLLVPTMCGLICTVRVSRLSKPSGKGVLKRLLYFVHLNSERQWEWAPTSPSATRHRLVRTLLLETHVLWYSAFDATVIAVVSVLGAVGPLLAWSACVGVGVAVAVLFGTQLVIVALARPCNRRVDDWMCVLTLALSTTSVTLRVVYGAAESDDERRNREDLLRWASALDLLLTILSALPLLPSFVAGLRHCYAKALNPRPRDTVDEEHSDTPIESWRCDPVEELEELNTLSSFTPIVVGMSTEESLELPLLQRMVAHKHANKSRSTQPIIISAVASTDVLVPRSTAEAHDADMLHHFVSPSITHLDLETEIRRDGASHVSELIVAYQQHQ